MAAPSAKNPPAGWFVLAFCTLLAPALGGATELWAKSILLLVTAFVFLWRPPRRSLGLIWNLIFATLALFSFSGFIPAAWVGVPAWRQTLVQKYGVMMPGTLSAQPWLSVEGCALFLCGLAWAYFILTQNWTISSRQKAVRIYGLGVTALGALSLAAYLFHFTVPFWPPVGNSPINFGFFPNRNQTANVLALAAIMMTALTFETVEYQGKRGFFWLPPLLLTCMALVVDYSRAGVVLFFGGAAVWVACTITTSRSKRTGALCLAGIVLLLAGFLLYGGDTLKRFQPEPKDNARQWTDFRFNLQADAVSFVDQAPALGQGLGNFEYIFPLYRTKSAAQNRALHPESDWLWAAAELGWPTAILIFVGVAYWLPQTFPFARKTGRRLRSAAAVCGVAFSLHGLVDVSGHRAGAAWPALFFLSIAFHPNRRLKPAAWTAPLFRGVGLVLIAVAAWWLASNHGETFDRDAPTSSTLARLRDRSDAALKARDYPGVIATTTEALSIVPLDWRLYFQRAVASAVSHTSTTNAAKDFYLSRYLVPQWAESCFLEGELWLALDKPDRGLYAWEEALRRAGDESPQLYSRMLADQPLNESVRASLEDLSRDNREYWLVFLDYASPLECDLQIGDLLGRDPALLTLTREQRRNLFSAWYVRGNRSLLISSLLEYPNWLPEGWYWVARDYAAKKDFRAAYELSDRYTKPPAMPEITSSAPITDLERNYFVHSDDLQYGIDLFFAQRKLQRNKDALHTLLSLARTPGRPDYVLYLEAQMYAELKQWENAWNARVEFRLPEQG